MYYKKLIFAILVFGLITQGMANTKKRTFWGWGTSPEWIQFGSISMGLSAIILPHVAPKTDTPLIFIPHVDQQLKVSMSDTAFKIGKQLPLVYVPFPYLYYLFSNDQYKVEKAFVYTEAVLMTAGLTAIGKYSVGRQRPSGPSKRSFPSGHSSSAFVFASFLADDLFHSYHDHHLALRYLYLTTPFAVASFVALSRVAGKRHHFSDVVAGAAIGTIVGHSLYKFHFDEKGNYRNLKTSNWRIFPVWGPKKRYGAVNFFYSF